MASAGNGSSQYCRVYGSSRSYCVSKYYLPNAAAGHRLSGCNKDGRVSADIDSAEPNVQQF